MPAILFVLLLWCAAGDGSIRIRKENRLCSNNRPAYVPGELLVKYRSYADRGEMDDFHDRLKIKVLKRMKRARLRHLKVSADLDVEEAIKLYESDPNVEYAEPNYYVYAAATTPDDTGFSEQWGLHNIGQTVDGSAGTPDADMDAPEAWDITTGSNDVIIAVIDTGVAYDHPELAGNIWQNTVEVTNEEDDDGNGYIDDIRGWDFVDNDNDPMDYNGHGTHVAGTFAAISNNNRGIAGVMWCAQIMPLRFLDTVGEGTTADAILAIDYAIDNGAKILNNSWGGGGYSQALKEAIERAKAAGALFIAAAGNEEKNNDMVPNYPSSYDVDNIIAVAATDQNDNLAYFSNYGATSVHVAAPGTNIYSTVPARKVVFSDNFDQTIAPWTTGGTNNTWGVTADVYNSASYSLSDSFGADTDYLNDTTSWARSPAIDLSGKNGCKWVYYMDLDTEYDFDFLYIETSTDDITWTFLNRWSGSTSGYFYEFEEDFTPYDGVLTFYVRFRLTSDYSVTRDGVYIDDVELTCYSSNYTADTQDEHFEGTSMVAPHVAGLAGLIWSHRPSLTYSQVKDYILNGVDIVSDLSGRLITEGRINAYTSLILPLPPWDLSAAAISGGQIDLTWSDSCTGEIGFKIERRTGSGGNYVQIATTVENTTSYADTDVQGGTTYTYRVRVYDANGDSAYSNEASATTPAPSDGGGDSDTDGDGRCFIATAAHGSMNVPLMAVLALVTAGFVGLLGAKRAE